MALNTLKTLETLVSFPSVSADPAFKQGLLDAHDFLVKTLHSMEFKVESVETPLHPIIIAERIARPGAPHVVIYGHYDVQPPDPLEQWLSPPFRAEIHGDRVYGRGAADNKGPVAVMLSVVSRLFETHPELNLNLTFLFEGEEEIGSPSFKSVLEKYRQRLSGDFLLACDSGSQTEDQLVITAGLRGITCLEMTASGPAKDLHSGVYGGAVLNPIKALMDLCHLLHDSEGKVAIPGFYDDVLPVEAWEREAVASLQLQESELCEFLGVNALFHQAGLTPVEAIRFAPTVEYNGIKGGYQGAGSKTIIPSTASVKISCRLVANQDPDKIQELVIAFLQTNCPAGIELAFQRDHNGKAYLVIPPGRPHAPADQNKHLNRAFHLTEEISKTIFGKPAVYLREGGSIPIINDIKETLQMDSLLLGLYLPEDGYHAPNESFSLAMMRKGETLLDKLLLGLACTG